MTPERYKECRRIFNDAIRTIATKRANRTTQETMLHEETGTRVLVTRTEDGDLKMTPGQIPDSDRSVLTDCQGYRYLRDVRTETKTDSKMWLFWRI